MPMATLFGRALGNDRDVPNARWDLLVAPGTAVGLRRTIGLDAAKLGGLAREWVRNELLVNPVPWNTPPRHELSLARFIRRMVRYRMVALTIWQHHARRVSSGLRFVSIAHDAESPSTQRSHSSSIVQCAIP